MRCIIEGGSLAESLRAASLEALLQRELLASTGVGKNVAIPHVKLDGLKQVAASLTVLAEGVEWAAVDGEPVQVLFTVIRPARSGEFHDPDRHLEMMRWIARLGRDQDFRRFALQARTRTQLVDLTATPLPTDRSRPDPSIEVHVCHGPLREVEVAVDRLRAALVDPELPALTSDQIALVTPDLPRYAPLCAAVLAEAGLPFQIVGRLGHRRSATQSALLQIVDLARSRLRADDLFDQLDAEAVHHRHDDDQRANAEQDADEREPGDDRDRALLASGAQIAPGDHPFEAGEQAPSLTLPPEGGGDARRQDGGTGL